MGKWIDGKHEERYRLFQKIMMYCVRENISAGELFAAIMSVTKCMCKCQDDDGGSCETCGFLQRWDGHCMFDGNTPDYLDIDDLERGADERFAEDYELARRIEEKLEGEFADD